MFISSEYFGHTVLTLDAENPKQFFAVKIQPTSAYGNM
jgi:hypothetical protein